MQHNTHSWSWAICLSFTTVLSWVIPFECLRGSGADSDRRRRPRGQTASANDAMDPSRREAIGGVGLAPSDGSPWV